MPVGQINPIKMQLTDRVLFLIFHSSFQKWIIETNNEINSVTVNFSLFLLRMVANLILTVVALLRALTRNYSLVAMSH